MTGKIKHDILIWKMNNGEEDEQESNIGLHYLLKPKLFDDEKQEERSGPPRIEKVLSILPKTRAAQGSEISAEC